MPKLTDRCSSTGVYLVGKGFTTFACPACGEDLIGRSAEARDQSVHYRCKSCGFTGP
jgi:predicted RNA-binding Zn-ribbon protein involved in translation (DUF1610 family)